MKIGIAADHGGFPLKQVIASLLTDQHEIIDFGAFTLDSDDDYPDFVIPLAHAVSTQVVDRGIAICGSGVGATIAVNKVKGVRAALIHDTFSAHQGVEDDNMNLLCLGGRIVGEELAKEIITRFLGASFSGAERHKRRLEKVNKLEKE
ncbi:RpiB/LacA/LacB family sugar-phosphate isomerase [Reichenbachiella agarivorans]|uniref:RpiB/LacA/LacB family sugar-phosphate isomerase n=1 Tax=Reichenbachiella agarivorans TaxID=2979464 RepID=A0ABY6CNF9_9BACT|nr:RpiB/LacA/LacB family sugar-phosphate isomerase [Reichenbachiella agarivorans]UXP31570.1 RpiB/LacA/LacB family sugar-phosphate isomerase [Reichenbachiella agarivorans]